MPPGGYFGSALVVDLDGHTISSGLVLDPGAEQGFFAGVRNSGHTNFVVRGGTVTGFGYGVRLMAGVTHNLVTAMTLRSNTSAGVELFDADNGRIGNTVRGNTMTLNGDGVTLLGGSEGSTIAGNTFTGNLGRAVYGFDASHHTIEDNTVSGDTGDPLLDSDGGISLEASTDTVVSGNFLSDIGDAAILVTEWPEFGELDWREVKERMSGDLLIDGRNFVDRATVERAGFTYEGIGR